MADAAGRNRQHQPPKPGLIKMGMPARDDPVFEPERGDWRTFLGNTIRVLDGQGMSVMGEGVVVAVCEVPTLVVRAADGALSHHATNLPIEVMEWRRL